jgi:tetratricopeptide (TPR) repeat protein
VLEARKKISKKQMKEDKLVTSYYKAQTFILENQARILIGAGIIAVIVVAVILFANKRASNNQSAATMLAKVMPLYDEGNYKEAITGVTAANIPGLKKIVDEYGSTEQGETAKMYLANAYSMTGNNDAAYEMYNDYSGSNPLFKTSALSGKAGILETKKEYEKAADLYQDASKISKSNPSNAEMLLKAGIDYLKAGKKDDAKNMFETLKKDYANFASMLEVDRYLAQIEM